MAAPPPPANAAPPPPANPLNYIPKDQAFITTQAEAGLAHEMYRRTGNSILDRQSMATIARLQNWTQPVTGAPPFQIAPPAGSAAAKRLLAAAIANRGTVESGIGDFSTGLPDQRPSAADRAFAQALVNNPGVRGPMQTLGMSFVKQLGWDLDITTTLWHWANPAGGTGNVVCKTRLSNGNAMFAMNNSLAKIFRLSRAPHITHRADLMSHLSAGAPALAAQANALSWHVDLQWTEYARHGDLGKWIARVSDEGETFPRSVLWCLFECLIDACVAMAYPPRTMVNPPHAWTGADLPENIPGNPVLGYGNIVHMTLSPENIHIEEYQNNIHDDVPRLQAGGFEYSCYPSNLGLPVFMPPNNFTRLSNLWTRRVAGKERWYLPEHFSAEWDHVNYEPYSEGLTNWATGAGAAGAFNEKSNIFHIALNIWCCMLLHQPEIPPRATPVPRSGPNMGNNGWTYTGEMRFRDYHSQFGRLLCDLVSDCCKHMPADRPNLTQVRARVAAGMARNPLSNNDRRWVQRTLHQPGAPPPPVPEPGTRPAGAVVALPF